MAALLPEARPGDAVVGLVDDDELRAALQELVATSVGLDEVGGDDDVRVLVEQRLVHHQAPLEALDGAGQQQHGVDAELRRQLALPLLGQGRRAEDRAALDGALREQLGRDQTGLHRLADAHVVGDQQPDDVLAQGHQQRDVLVAAGAHGDAGQRAERPGAGGETDPECGAQQGGRRAVAEVLHRGGGEGGGLDTLVGEDTDHVRRPTAQRLEQQEVRSSAGQHHPLTSAGTDEAADGVLPAPGVTASRRLLGHLAGAHALLVLPWPKSHSCWSATADQS